MLLIPSSHIFFHPKEKMKKGHVSSPNILTWKKGLENERGEGLHNGNQSGFECGFLNSTPLGNTESLSLKRTEGGENAFSTREMRTHMK